MLRLHDNASSGNAYKIRLLLAQLGIPFERLAYDTDRGDTRTPEFLSTKNPNGRIPVLELADGRCLAESNAILCYLAEGTPLLPPAAGEEGRWLRAEVMQWLFFEQSYVEPQIGSLRYWTLTGKLDRRSPDMIAGKRAYSLRALAALERALSRHDFLAGDRYTIADMAVFAYAAHAEEAGLDLAPYPAFRAWIARVEAQPGFLAERFPYTIDPHAAKELG